MKVNITERINGYEFSWPDCGVTIKATQVRLHESDSRVTGYLTVFAMNGDNKQVCIEPQSQFNFSAPRTRTELAKNLNLKTSTPPWGQIIDNLCYGVQERIRAGEPVRELWTSEDIPELEFILHPLLIAGVPTVIYGEKSATKSTFSLLVYLCLLLPWTDNPYGFGVPSEPTKTLILDWELPGDIAQRNLKYLTNGMGLGSVPLYHRHCSSPLANDLETIANHVANIGAKVVIVDSLARAAGGELNHTESPNAFFQALDKLKVTSLILAQTNKSDNKVKTIYGNALFSYYARAIFELCRSENSPDKGPLDVALFHREGNLTERLPEMGFRLTFDRLAQRTVISPQRVNIGDFSGKVSIQKAVIKVLTKGALSVEEIAEETGVEIGTLRVALTRMKAKAILVNPERGLWGLRAEC